MDEEIEPLLREVLNVGEVSGSDNNFILDSFSGFKGGWLMVKGGPRRTD